MYELSNRGKDILNILRKNLLEGHAPSVRELQAQANIPSVSSVYTELKKLEKAGYIKMNRKSARGISLALKNDEITAALPVISALDPITESTAPESPEETVPFMLPQRLAGRCFAMTVPRDIGEFKKGDRAVFCRTDIVENGSPAAVSLNGELTVGIVYLDESGMGGTVNIADRSIKLGADADIAVVGRFLGIVRKYF